MPVTIVRKITGAITALTSLTKPSPSGFSATPTVGQIMPTSTPSTIAASTWICSRAQIGCTRGGAASAAGIIPARPR